MVVPTILVTAPLATPHSESRPSRLRRTLGFGRRKKSGEGDTSPTPARTPTPSPKRKDTSSPVMLKRKYLRKVRLPALAQVTGGKVAEDQPCQVSPSIFEEELAENKSPNDPEFVRRASHRWQRKTGSVQPPLQLLSAVGVQQPALVWPSSPSQQSAFRRRVSPRPQHYMPQSPFLSGPPSPVLGRAFSRGSPQYSSLGPPPHAQPETTFMRSSPSNSSLGLPRRRGSSSTSPHQSPSRARKDSLQPPRSCSPQRSPSRARKHSLQLPQFLSPHQSPSRVRKASLQVSQFLSPQLSPSGARKATLQPPPPRSPSPCGGAEAGLWCGALDDSVTAAVRKQQLREVVGAGLAAPLLRLSVRLRRSFRRSRQHNSSTLTTSASCHSNLLQLPGSGGFNLSPPASPSSIPRSASLPPHAFNDIFLEEPQLAHKFAIMFPSEPRPEWHRHLRQVIHKAGQRVFKKPDPHDTTIPENLRHQLKHIYVY